MTPQARIERTAHARELLARLIAFDTTTVRSNLELIAFLEAYLAGQGVATTRVPAPDGQPKACLAATIGPSGLPAVALSGHTDCVPVTGQEWDSDPFTLTERNGLLYGRGTCDMKGYLACMLASVPDYRRRKLKVPIQLLFSYDEEIGCKGVQPLIDRFGADLVRPRAVLVGEPTSMEVVDAHKGANRFEVKVKGLDAHTSMPHLGVNAIAAAARMLAELQRIEDELKARHQNPRFDPPWTTMSPTSIEGGVASNIVPAACSFQFGLRALPGLDPRGVMAELQGFADRELIPRMREVSPEATVEVRALHLTPPFQAEEGSEAVALAMRLAARNEAYAVSYATEAAQFEDGRCPSVICGPGDIAQAHKPNEFIAIEQLEKCLVYLDRLGDWASS